MLRQILEFLLHAGWKNTNGHRLSLSKVYNSSTHLVSEVWELGTDTFTVDDVSEINLNFDLSTFVICPRD